MANSPAVVREIRALVRGEDGQGVIDVYVFVECLTFPIAQGWRTAQVPETEPFVDWLSKNFGKHLEWAVGAPE